MRDTLLHPGDRAVELVPGHVVPTTEAPRCPENAAPTEVLCRELFDAAAELIATLGAALEGMPKTLVYTDISRGVSDFESLYQSLISTDCYTATAAASSAEGCKALAELLTLAWLYTTGKIDQLTQT